MLFSVIFASFASAATIHGSVYDLSLNKIDKAVVSVDSVPKQTIVAKDGDYSFILPVGSYTINANAAQGAAEEVLEVKEEGDFTVDLILFPGDEEELNLDDVNVELEKNNTILVIIIILVLLVIGGLIWVFLLHKRILKIFDVFKREKEAKKEEKKEVEVKGDLEQMLEFIKKEGGRTNQKDIRKQFGLSEAKISLMVTELEDKGKIKRIKKGRGNVIVLS